MTAEEARYVASVHRGADLLRAYSLALEAEKNRTDPAGAWADFTQIAHDARAANDRLTIRLAQRALRGEVNLEQWEPDDPSSAENEPA